MLLHVYGTCEFRVQLDSCEPATLRDVLESVASQTLRSDDTPPLPSCLVAPVFPFVCQGFPFKLNQP